MTLHRLPVALALTLIAGSAVAHDGHGAAGFASGFAHPFSGLDHLLAMVAVGLYAARQAGTSRWALPAGFLVSMLAGAGLGALGLALPLVEAGVAASVLVLGLLIAFVGKLRLAAALPLVGLFAVFHGHAHHAEMVGEALLSYAAGFVAATGALHAAGYLVARVLPESGWALYARQALGALIAGTGLVLLGG